MRTLTNPGADPVEIPSLGVSIAPGETAEVDWPKGSPVPDCLVEEQPKPKTPAKSEDTK